MVSTPENKYALKKKNLEHFCVAQKHWLPRWQAFASGEAQDKIWMQLLMKTELYLESLVW